MSTKADIANAEDINELLARFYGRLKRDDVLAAHFEHIDLATHLPRIAAFWNMVLFGDHDYRGDVMGKHLQLHTESPITREHSERWLALFREAIDARYSGPNATSTKTRAASIMALMRVKLDRTGG